MEAGRLHTVARVEDVPPGSARAVQAGDRELALFNVDGTFHATQSECLHLKGPLCHGRLEAGVVSCPWHGWQYDVTTGENEFDRAIVLETFDVVVEDGEVKVLLELERGLELIRTGRYYDAHDVLEDEWRAAEPAERDFLQGLVHVAVAWYQAGRGNRVGCERQLEKASRRLAPYAPVHRDLDVAALLASVEAARGRFPDLPPPVLQSSPR